MMPMMPSLGSGIAIVGQARADSRMAPRSLLTRACRTASAGPALLGGPSTALAMGGAALGAWLGAMPTRRRHSSAITAVWSLAGVRAQPSREFCTALKAGGSSSRLPTLHVGLVGYGLVGKELVSQMLKSSEGLEAELGVKLEIAAVARSKTMVLLPEGKASSLSGGSWPSGEVDVDLEKFGKNVLKAAADHPGDRALIVDNTASDEPVEFYEAWLAAGVDVVTPNKRAGSGPYARYQSIMEAAKKGGSGFLYEATVGAGLPIIGPLQVLRRAGDEVVAVEGIFSGTLSYLFNTWKVGMKFSEVVREAVEMGFTEPDPRDDLSGTDVQRKVTILARELGLKLELDDVPVKSLVPDALQDWQPADGENLAAAYVKELEAYDDEMTSLLEEADKAQKVLRFVGAVDVKAGTASVKLAQYPADHPFASTQFADNIVAFSTSWYTPRPLVVQGPGAGAAVTAAGIFGNVMEAMSGMKAASP